MCPPRGVLADALEALLESLDETEREHAAANSARSSTSKPRSHTWSLQGLVVWQLAGTLVFAPMAVLLLPVQSMGAQSLAPLHIRIRPGARRTGCRERSCR